jgi:actin-related protein
MYTMMSSVLALYPTGRTTGCVLDSGHGATHVVPVFEGFALPFNNKHLYMGGEDVTEFLTRLLHQRLGYLGTHDIQEIKERFACVALDFEKESLRAEEKHYELPDGSMVTVGPDECLRCAEALFNPRLAGRDHEGVDELVVNAIKGCDWNLYRPLYSSIVLSGGNTMFPGFAERMNQEVCQRAPQSYKVKVVEEPKRHHLAWLGGSILASLSTFQSMWISKRHYDEAGPSIVHRMCAR